MFELHFCPKYGNADRIKCQNGRKLRLLLRSSTVYPNSINLLLRYVREIRNFTSKQMWNEIWKLFINDSYNLYANLYSLRFTSTNYFEWKLQSHYDAKLGKLISVKGGIFEYIFHGMENNATSSKLGNSRCWLVLSIVHVIYVGRKLTHRIFLPINMKIWN